MGARTVKSVGKRKPIDYKIRGKTYHKAAREARPKVKVAIYSKYKKAMSQSPPVHSLTSSENTPNLL